MSKHTTFKIGGPADYFIIVETKEELRSILNYANYKIIGNGSNLIVSDKGYRGTIFKLGQAFGRISYEKPFITAGAAITITELLKCSIFPECSNTNGFPPFSGTWYSSLCVLGWMVAIFSPGTISQ